tara:strand:+ start:5833 stop:6204 length:372 start_codon:yes stop_codon:yes gene_type:complete
MAFKLKTIGELFGIHEELSEWGRPVFFKDLEGSIKAEANRDGTTFIDPENCGKDELQEAVVHENVHHDQMKSGRLGYDRHNVYWKPTTRSHMKTYTRETMREGDDDLAWEAEAYNESDKVKKK